MAWYKFHDKKKQPLIASDSIIWIDGRLSTCNKIEAAREKLSKLKAFKGMEADYIAKLNGQRQVTGFIKI